jgi:hypothetical protein
MPKSYSSRHSISKHVFLGPDQTVTAETWLAFWHEMDKIDEALPFLRQAIDHGLPPRIDLNIEKEPYSRSLQGDSRFAALVVHAKERAAAQKPN